MLLLEVYKLNKKYILLLELLRILFKTVCFSWYAFINHICIVWWFLDTNVVSIRLNQFNIWRKNGFLTIFNTIYIPTIYCINIAFNLSRVLKPTRGIIEADWQVSIIYAVIAAFDVGALFFPLTLIFWHFQRCSAILKIELRMLNIWFLVDFFSWPV